MTRLARAARRAALVMGTGYALCFFSETMFWSLWRPDEEAHGRVLQWFLYSLLGYLTLVVIRQFRLRDAWSVLLAGAFFGWVGEGVFAMTVFGDPSMPFPVTIAWTALAWHGPLSVLVGWYALGLALRAPGVGRTLALAFGLGLFWGFWGYGWMAETPPVGAELPVFFIHAVLTTGCLALAHLAIAAGRPGGFAPSRWGIGIASALVLTFFAVVTVPTVPIAPLVLVPLLAVLFLALRRHAARSGGGDVLDAFAAPLRRRNLAALAVMPLTASVVYGVAQDNLPPTGTLHLGFAVASILLGTGLFAVALVRAMRSPARQATP